MKFLMGVLAATFLVIGISSSQAMMRITDDRGGRIGTYVDKYQELRTSGDTVMIDVAGEFNIPKGGIAVPWPLQGVFRRATLDGMPAPEAAGNEVVIHRLPAKIVMQR